MIKKITQYPTQTGFNFGGTVRHFDASLISLIDDLKDTIEANTLEGLSAFQIGSPLNVIVIKKEDEYLEIINPSIFIKEGHITPTEKTAYYPDITVVTKRAQTIKVVYEDREGKQQYLTAQDDLAVLIQRKNDYLMGSTFICRLNPEEKIRLENKLQNKTTTNSDINCSLSPFSDKILNIIKYTLIVGLIALVGIFFSNFQPMLKIFESILMWIIVGLIGFYFVRALYEGKRCGVCQLGNVAAVTIKKSIHLVGLYLLNYWLLF
jgi:peptide deformylase